MKIRAEIKFRIEKKKKTKNSKTKSWFIEKINKMNFSKTD